MLTRLAHERQPSSELPFVAPTCSNFSGLLPHQTKTVEVSPMSLSIIRHRLALPTCRWTTNCHVTYLPRSFPLVSMLPSWIQLCHICATCPWFVCLVTTRMLRSSGTRAPRGALCTRERPRFSLAGRGIILATPRSAILAGLFPFSSCPVLLSCPGVSRLRSPLVCYACAVPRGPATPGEPPPSCPCTG